MSIKTADQKFAFNSLLIIVLLCGVAGLYFALLTLNDARDVIDIARQQAGSTTQDEAAITARVQATTRRIAHRQNRIQVVVREIHGAAEMSPAQRKELSNQLRFLRKAIGREQKEIDSQKAAASRVSAKLERDADRVVAASGAEAQAEATLANSFLTAALVALAGYMAWIALPGGRRG